jgi:hypothetical protein
MAKTWPSIGKLVENIQCLVRPAGAADGASRRTTGRGLSKIRARHSDKNEIDDPFAEILRPGARRLIRPELFGKRAGGMTKVT